MYRIQELSASICDVEATGSGDYTGTVTSSSRGPVTARSFRYRSHFRDTSGWQHADSRSIDAGRSDSDVSVAVRFLGWTVC